MKTLRNLVTAQESTFLKKCAQRDQANYLFIYGGGEGAKNTYDYLQSEDIKVDKVVVNEKYLNDVTDIGQKVESIEKVMKSLTKKCDVIISFDGYQEKLLKDYADKISDIYVYDVFKGKYRGISYDFFEENEEEFEKIYHRLEDGLSKTTMVAFLNQKISEEYGYLSKVKNENQYFDESVIDLEDGEVFIDCGAYIGDSITGFESNMNVRGKRKKKIIAFEPDEGNFGNLCKNVHDDSIVLINKGIWIKPDTLLFNIESNGNSHEISTLGTEEVEVESIDHLMQNEKVTFIKMDIEGAELDALKGAKKTIQRDHPKLAICVYHKKEDLLEIPQYIVNLYSDYKLYLRAYEDSATELVLYAV